MGTANFFFELPQQATLDYIHKCFDKATDRLACSRASVAPAKVRKELGVMSPPPASLNSSSRLLKVDASAHACNLIQSASHGQSSSLSPQRKAKGCPSDMSGASTAWAPGVRSIGQPGDADFSEGIFSAVEDKHAGSVISATSYPRDSHQG